ncbi:hypothetical protein TIFTF001_004602 [Ficus carica]|uniref:Uncharacterized protein n=1 Tax=Ficus carica TaxID=3494 RepID=A0AA87ZJU6_FICCA|nr:hypothetical protein TIFTF001_004602 [Ficus carica]
MRTAALAVVVAEGRRSEKKAEAVGVVWQGLLMFGAGAAARRSELWKMKLEKRQQWRGIDGGWCRGRGLTGWITLRRRDGGCWFARGRADGGWFPRLCDSGEGSHGS